MGRYDKSISVYDVMRLNMVGSLRQGPVGINKTLFYLFMIVYWVRSPRFWSLCHQLQLSDVKSYRELPKTCDLGIVNYFWAHLCMLHGGLICIAFRPSVCLSVCHWTIIHLNILFQRLPLSWQLTLPNKRPSQIVWLRVKQAGTRWTHFNGLTSTSSCIKFLFDPHDFLGVFFLITT